ncbi:MAG: penicillin-binding protein 2 [Phycisphaerae bacterium]|jgi:cell division protein FtsI (penicillin-binding protein 3)
MPSTGQRLWVGHAAVAVLCVALVALIGKLAYIQVRLRPSLLEWAQRRQTSTITLPGSRGKILDRRQRVLVGSHDQLTVFADPLLVTEKADTARALAGILGLTARDILARLERNPNSRYVVLKRGVSPEEARAIDRLDNCPGIGLVNEPARVYAMGTLAAHVVGFVGLDDDGRLGRGLAGIELACQEVLKDSPGRRVVFWDAKRQKAMFQDAGAYVEPRDGLDVILTIDAAIQEIVERELANALAKFKAQATMCVVMSPKTGEVLAMAVAPTFDPAEPGRFPPERWRNRLLTDPVEPGSVFKPFILAGALQAGLTRPSEVIYCNMGLYVIGRRQLSDHHPYGNLSVEQIITKSSNIGMAKIGERMGNRRMYETLVSLGFGRPTGIDLPGEDRGLLMPLRRWNSYTTSSVPMGQEVAQTPIQLITAFCALVNGGRLPKPYVVAGVVDRAGNVVEDRRPREEFPQVITPEAAETIKQILIKTVNEGTGRPAALEHWQVMGKTGTAQVPWSPEARRAGQRKGYEPDAYLGSFMAAAPGDDPQIAVLFMVRKPQRSIGYYGGTVAAPSVKVIMQEVLTYLNVPHERTKPTEQTTHLVDLRD